MADRDRDPRRVVVAIAPEHVHQWVRKNNFEVNILINNVGIRPDIEVIAHALAVDLDEREVVAVHGEGAGLPRSR